MSHSNLLIYENISQCLTMKGVVDKKGRGITEADLGIIENASIVVDTDKETIVWVGEMHKVPREYDDVINTVNGEGTVWLPELVECHTHLVYAGTRHHDFAKRVGGKTYGQIAQEGGGILSTIEHTRKAPREELIENAEVELDRFQKFGVGAIEIKSGYGLSLESEIKMLECIREMQQNTSMTLVPTFLPAHATPPEFKGKSDDYVSVICREWIPEIAKRKLATFFDAFVEEGFFTFDQTKKMLEVAKEHGMKLKLHTDQFTDLGATQMAVDLGATSVDHLEHIPDEAIRKVGASDTVAVLLPGASLFTGTPYPPARKLIEAGARVALSTDFNPGTCPSRNLPLMMTIACCQMKMTIPEAIAAVTYNAAAALGLENKMGSLEAGKAFRVLQVRAESYEFLPYCFGELD